MVTIASESKYSIPFIFITILPSSYNGQHNTDNKVNSQEGHKCSTRRVGSEEYGQEHYPANKSHGWTASFDFDVVMWSWSLPASPTDVDDEVEPDKGQEQVIAKEH